MVSNRIVLQEILSRHAPAFTGDSVEARTLDALARATLSPYNRSVPERDPERDRRDLQRLLARLDGFAARLADFRAYAVAHFCEWEEARIDKRRGCNALLYGAQHEKGGDA